MKVKPLQKRIDEVLYYLWDPIGAKEDPAARAEYSIYVDVIFSLLISGKDDQTIAKQLMIFEVTNMGMQADGKHALKIGRILIEAMHAIEDGIS